MKVNCVNNIFTPRIYLNFKSKKNDLKFNASLESDIFERSSFLSSPSRNDFLKKYRKYKSLNHFLSENILPENKIGSGLKSDVYKFTDDEFKDYVIKVCRDKRGLNLATNLFAQFNFGQPIVKLSNSIYILKRQEGEEHSIHNWSAVVTGREKLTRKQAVKFYNDIRKISAFPQENYNEYASNLKTLQDSGFKVDSLNPNNTLIDFNKQKINFVDFYIPKREQIKNCYIDMVASLLDYRLYLKYMSFLTPEEQKNMIACSNEIVEKSYKAAKIAGLPVDEDIFYSYIENVDLNWGNPGLRDEYKCFKKYVDVI